MKWFALCLALVSSATFASQLRVECDITNVQGNIKFERMEMDLGGNPYEFTRIRFYDRNGKVTAVDLTGIMYSTYSLQIPESESSRHLKLFADYDRSKREVYNVVWDGLINKKDFYHIEALTCYNLGRLNR